MEKKNYIWLVVVLILLLVLGASVFFFTSGRSSQTPQSVFATPETTPTAFSQPVPTVTPKPAGNVWVVSKTEVDTIVVGKFSYIVDEFVNENDPTLKIKASCMSPKAPAPEVGDRYYLNPWNVLVPCGETSCTSGGDINSPLQRFSPVR